MEFRRALIGILVLCIVLVFGDDEPRAMLDFHAVTINLPSQQGMGTYDISTGFNMSQVWPDGSQLILAMKYKTASTPFHYYVSALQQNGNEKLLMNYSTTDMYHPAIFTVDPSDPAVYPNFNYNVELAMGTESPTGTFTTDVSTATFFQLWLDGSVYWKNEISQYCPGYIYHYIQSPKDQSYAYNLTLQGLYWSSSFSELWLRHGAWPVPNVTYDYYWNDMTIFEAPIPPVVVENSLDTDRWFMVFRCKIKKAVTTPYWQIGAYMDPTCKKSCFYTGGTCNSDAAIPFCSCSRWFKDGEATCTELFAGDYTLMALGGFGFIGIMFFSCIWMKRFINRRSRSLREEKEDPQVERRRLLESDL